MRPPPHPLWAILATVATGGAGGLLAFGFLPAFPMAIGVTATVLVGTVSLATLAFASMGHPARAPVAGFAAALIAAASGARFIFTGALRLIHPDGAGALALLVVAAIGIIGLALGLTAAVRLREPAWLAAEGASRRLLPKSAHGALEAGAFSAAIAYAAGALPVGGSWPWFTGDEATLHTAGMPGALALEGSLIAAVTVVLLLVVPIRTAAWSGSVLHGIPKMKRSIMWSVQSLTFATLILVAAPAASMYRGVGLVLPVATLVGIGLSLYSARRAWGGIPKVTPQPATAAGIGITQSCPRCDAILTVDAEERPARYACPECGESVYLLEA